MSFPIFPEKHELPALLTAEHMINFRRKYGGLDKYSPPDAVVLCLYKGVFRGFGLRYRSSYVKGFPGDVYLLKRAQGRVGVLGNFGFGAPALTSIAEEMIAWGTKRLLVMSLAGSLQPDLVSGSIVVCDRAVRDEGTSYHYLPPSRDIEASPSLVSLVSNSLESRGIEHTVGSTWSTDAPYRETKAEATYFREQAVKTVDMESAGVFAVGKVRAVDTASIFVVGDSLAGPTWMAPTNMRDLDRRLKNLLRVLVDILGRK